MTRTNNASGWRYAVWLFLASPGSGLAAQNNVVAFEQHDPARSTGTSKAGSPTLQRHDQRSLDRVVGSIPATRVVQTHQHNLLPALEATRPPAQASAVTGAPRNADQEVANSAPAYARSVPDERPLWRMLHENRLVELDRTVAALEQEFTSWRPSDPLTAERSRLQRESDIAVALRNGSAETVRDLIASAPEQFNCLHVDRIWKAADVFSRTRHLNEVNALYRDLIAECKSEEDRIATLYRAQRDLPPEQANALIELEAVSGQRGVQGEAAFQRLRYERAVAELGREPPDSESAARWLSTLAPSIFAYRDGATATFAGWISLAHRDTAEAISWFETAQTFTPGSVEATLGLAQTLIEVHAYDDAQASLEQPMLRGDPRAQKARAQIALARADEAYKQHRYQQSLEFLETATMEGLPPTDTALLRGWNLYFLGHYAQAADAFRVRFRLRYDDDSAEGLAQAIHATNPNANLDRIADGRPEDGVATYLGALDAQQQYYRKQFVESRTTLHSVLAGPADHQRIARYIPADLTGVDAGSVASGLSWSDHVGAPGQGRLDVVAPELRGEWINNATQFELRYRQLFMNAGTTTLDQTVPGLLSALGAAVPNQGDKPALTDKIRGLTIGGAVHAEELQVMVADNARVGAMPKFGWSVSLGATQGAPSGFQPNLFGTVSQETTWGAWSVYGGTTPVRDSMLSWRGMSLPEELGGQKWGAVRRAAIGTQIRWQIAPRWNISTATEAQWLTGMNVVNNEGISADLSASYDLRLPGFDYFSVGPAVHYLSYRRNENFYSWGQGGYYSPQSSLGTGIGIQWLSNEGRHWQIRGTAEAGWNNTLQHTERCFPLGLPSGLPNAGLPGSIQDIETQVSGLNCAGSHDQGPYAHVQFSGVVKLSSRLQAGALVDANITPGRDRQFAAIAFIRYMLGTRSSVFSRDLPKNTRDFYLQLDDGHN